MPCNDIVNFLVCMCCVFYTLLYYVICMLLAMTLNIVYERFSCCIDWKEKQSDCTHL